MTRSRSTRHGMGGLQHDTPRRLPGVCASTKRGGSPAASVCSRPRSSRVRRSSDRTSQDEAVSVRQTQLHPIEQHNHLVRSDLAAMLELFCRAHGPAHGLRLRASCSRSDDAHLTAVPLQPARERLVYCLRRASTARRVTMRVSARMSGPGKGQERPAPRPRIGT